MGAPCEYYDDLETRDREAREAALMAALPAQVAHARAAAAAFAERLAGIDAAAVDSREALARLPLIRKSDLIEIQKRDTPFGGLAATPLGALSHIFASPGPIYEPAGVTPDFWRMARALFAAGMRRGDVVHNTFSYHLTPAGLMMDSGARALGCAVVPGGVGNTEQQVMAIRDIRPNGYVGTPSFLKIILDKAAEMGADVSCLKHALVGGEPLPPSLRKEIQGHGLSVLQCYATADLGLIAYESAAMEGMILDENVILEIVRPGTGDPVSEGEVGEVVVTPFNRDYPLIRFATGDLSATLPGISPCGRTNVRIKGWMGRADQTAKVRGMFVHPSQVAEVVRRHPEVQRVRLVIDSLDNKDLAVLHCEIAPGGDEPALAAALAESFRTVCKLRGEARIVAPGTLANDGKIIDDIRRFD